MKNHILVIVALVFLLMGKSALGDQAAYISKEASQAAVKLLTGQTELRLFCASCGFTDYRSIEVKNLESKKVSDSENWEVFLNGEPIDLAYIYFNQNGVWKNAALAMGLEVRDVSEILPPPYIEVDAQKTIDHCWAISEELRADINSEQQRRGHQKTALCLENEIIKNAERLISIPHMAPETIRSNMEKLRLSYGDLYWSIYNGVKTCEPLCGTIYRSFHASSLSKLYEKMLKDIIEQRKKYGL